MVFGDWVVRNVKDTDNYPHDFKVGFARMPRLSADQEITIPLLTAMT